MPNGGFGRGLPRAALAAAALAASAALAAAALATAARSRAPPHPAERPREPSPPRFFTAVAGSQQPKPPV